MAPMHILVCVAFILAISMVTVAESTTCSSGRGYCNSPYSVCCSAINPGYCCPTGQYCCGRIVNFGCCPIGYSCGLTQCTRLARSGNGPTQVLKAKAGGTA
jgi:hypothetical protein